MRVVLIVGLGVLAGCSSGVLTIGPDTYRISTEALSRGAAEAEVVGAANKHCASLGRQAVVGSIDSTTASFATYAGAGVTFKCVVQPKP